MNGDSQIDNAAKSPRGAKKRARTRADLLAAARKVFAKRGYHEASILDITTEADVGVGTFYLHFRDKEEAFNTLIEEVLNVLREQVEAELSQQELPTLTSIVRALLRHAYEQRELFRIALTGGGQFSRMFQVQEMITRGLLKNFELYSERGLLVGYNVPFLAHCVTGVIAQGIIWWLTEQEQAELTPAEMAVQILRLLAGGLPPQMFDEDIGST
jgi:AcrR family transcriptional regulator